MLKKCSQLSRTLYNFMLLYTKRYIGDQRSIGSEGSVYYIIYGSYDLHDSPDGWQVEEYWCTRKPVLEISKYTVM